LVPYGRGAEAIARQCKEEGTEIAEEEAQALIDAYFASYPGTEQFLATCRARSQPPYQWLSTAFGRRRRFVRSTDRSVIGEQERQAQNFPIQGTVADAISRAIDHLYWYRYSHPECHFRMLLQIHDALLFEVPLAELAQFKEIVTECMCRRVPIYPRNVDNTPMPVSQPYYFAVDMDVAINWGEKITDAQLTELGITKSW